MTDLLDPPRGPEPAQPIKVVQTRAQRQKAQRSRRPASVFRALAIIFFFVPVALWAMGVQSATSDKRALAKFPHSFTSWKVMDEMAAYVNDHVPFRGTAVRLRADISQSLFGEAPPSAGGSFGEATAKKPVNKEERNFVQLPPAKPEPTIAGSQEVMVGKDGWLYLTGELVRECSSGATGRKAAIDGVRRLQKLLTAAGKSFYFTLAPDKSTAEPEHMPDNNAFAQCSAPAKKQTFQELAQAAIPGYVDMRSIIKQREAAEKRDYYYRKDTHWNGLAAAAFTETVAKSIDQNLLANTKIVESVRPYTGDLTQLLGAPSENQAFFTDVERQGVTTTDKSGTLGTSGIPTFKSRATTTGAPLVPGSTVVIGDSFAEFTLHDLEPFFGKITFIHSTTAYQAPKTTAEQIAKAKTVIWITVERYWADPSLGVIWTQPFLDKLETILQHPTTTTTSTTAAP